MHTTFNQYYILTGHPDYGPVLDWLGQRHIRCQIHLNRTRFWIPQETSLLTEFALRWAHSCPSVDSDLDLTTGLPL